MQAKGFLQIGVLVASITLMACTPPPDILFARGNAPDQGTETVTPTETAQPTETLEPTETQEATEPPEVTATSEATEESARAGCPGNPGGTPPVAATIAATYTVSEDEIMSWFCKCTGSEDMRQKEQ